ncbi:MAG: hypothetical protein ACMUIP_06900 [bacterium]
MQILKNVHKNTGTYKNFDGHLESDTLSLDTHIEEEKALDTSHDWNLEEAIDTSPSVQSGNYCRIKDRAFGITHKKSSIQKLLMPEMIIIPDK